jgi:hypothetical protein
VIFEYIPRRALAPRIWDKDDVDYLLFIRQHLNIDHRSNVRSEFDISALTQGIKLAIIQHHVKALYLPLAIEHLCCKGRKDEPGRPSGYQHRNTTRPSAHPDSIFALACRQGQHSTWIFELLVAASHCAIPWSDPEVSGWIFSEPNPIKKWLQAHQNDLREDLLSSKPRTYLRKLTYEVTSSLSCTFTPALPCLN